MTYPTTPSPFGRAVPWNPFNICFRPSLLTEEGWRARKRFFICVLGFPLCILLALLVSGAPDLSRSAQE